MNPPTQPLFKDVDGVIRFQKNAIVAYLLDHGGIDMNDLARLNFSDADRTQFAQLIGYSVSGFGSLSYVSTETARTADRKAEMLNHPAATEDADEALFIGYNEPNTRGLLQDMDTAMENFQRYTLTEQEVAIVYLALARLHDLELFGYQRDWESIATYCPRADEPDED